MTSQHANPLFVPTSKVQQLTLNSDVEPIDPVLLAAQLPQIYQRRRVNLPPFSWLPLKPSFFLYYLSFHRRFAKAEDNQPSYLSYWTKPKTSRSAPVPLRFTTPANYQNFYGLSSYFRNDYSQNYNNNNNNNNNNNHNDLDDEIFFPASEFPEESSPTSTSASSPTSLAALLAAAMRGAPTNRFGLKGVKYLNRHSRNKRSTTWADYELPHAFQTRKVNVPFFDRGYMECIECGDRILWLIGDVNKDEEIIKVFNIINADALVVDVSEKEAKVIGMMDMTEEEKEQTSTYDRLRSNTAKSLVAIGTTGFSSRVPLVKHARERGVPVFFPQHLQTLREKGKIVHEGIPKLLGTAEEAEIDSLRVSAFKFYRPPAEIRQTEVQKRATLRTRDPSYYFTLYGDKIEAIPKLMLGAPGPNVCAIMSLNDLDSIVDALVWPCKLRKSAMKHISPFMTNYFSNPKYTSWYNITEPGAVNEDDQLSLSSSESAPPSEEVEAVSALTASSASAT